MLLTDGTFAPSSYDCFIVGSGPAGMTLALALGQANKRVLVVESGDSGVYRQELSNSVGYGHYSGPYWNHHWVRTVGGTSAIWSGWCTLPGELEFDNPAVGVRWPVRHTDLLPYWQRATKLLEHDFVIVGYQRPMFERFSFRPISVAAAVRFGTKHLPTVQQSKMVDVLTGCSLVGLTANESRSAVTRLTYFVHQVNARLHFDLKPEQKVVLAAGGLGNAQLLLQPQEHSSVPVGNESGQVGRFLMEHPVFVRAAEIAIDASPERIWPGGRPFGVMAFTANAALMTSEGLHGCNLSWSPVKSEDGVTQYLSRQLGKPVHSYSVMVRAEMLPSPHNRIYLTGERGPSGLLRPAARCVLDARDFLNVETTLRLLGDTLIRLGRGRVKINNDQIYRDIRGGGHTMGTTRMGSDRAASVVDSECRVHGYENLYVAGSSVFSTATGYAHPTMTIVALSLRLADRLSGAR
jgi:choline dehydrogenase-like flavoprotein